MERHTPDLATAIPAVIVATPTIVPQNSAPITPDATNTDPYSVFRPESDTHKA